MYLRTYCTIKIISRTHWTHLQHMSFFKKTNGYSSQDESICVPLISTYIYTGRNLIWNYPLSHIEETKKRTHLPALSINIKKWKEKEHIVDVLFFVNFECFQNNATLRSKKVHIWFISESQEFKSHYSMEIQMKLGITQTCVKIWVTGLYVSVLPCINLIKIVENVQYKMRHSSFKKATPITFIVPVSIQTWNLFNFLMWESLLLFQNQFIVSVRLIGWFACVIFFVNERTRWIIRMCVWTRANTRNTVVWSITKKYR